MDLIFSSTSWWFLHVNTRIKEGNKIYKLKFLVKFRFLAIFSSNYDRQKNLNLLIILLKNKSRIIEYFRFTDN